MTSVFCCSFECGLSATVNSIGHWLETNGTWTFQTAIVRGGKSAVRCQLTSGIGTLKHQVGNSAIKVGRVYIYFNSLPTATTSLVAMSASGPPVEGAHVRFDASDSTIRAGVDSTSSAIGVPVTTGRWYRIDFKFEITAGDDTADVQVDGISCGQAAAAGTSGTSPDIHLGCSNTTTADHYYSSLVVSHTATDFPIGGGATLGFVPNHDGTHTATGTNITLGTTGSPIGGAAVTAATTESYAWVNGRPLGGGQSDATRLINQNAVAAAEYCEVGFERPGDQLRAPQAVEVLVADQTGSSANGTMSIKLNDNGTEDLIVMETTGSTSDRYTSKHYATMPGGGGAWTRPRFNDIRVRFGYSDDATPDQYFRGVIIEADFAEVNAQLYRRLPPTQRLYSDG